MATHKRPIDAPQPHGATVYVQVRVDLDAMRGWTDEQRRAFMDGIGKVVASQSEPATVK